MATEALVQVQRLRVTALGLQSNEAVQGAPKRPSSMLGVLGFKPVAGDNPAENIDNLGHGGFKLGIAH